MEREGWVCECAGEYTEKYAEECAEDYAKAWKRAELDIPLANLAGNASTLPLI